VLTGEQLLVQTSRRHRPRCASTDIDVELMRVDTLFSVSDAQRREAAPSTPLQISTFSFFRLNANEEATHALGPPSAPP